jgi:hypothetical protein
VEGGGEVREGGSGWEPGWWSEIVVEGCDAEDEDEDVGGGCGAHLRGCGAFHISGLARIETNEGTVQVGRYVRVAV